MALRDRKSLIQKFNAFITGVKSRELDRRLDNLTRNLDNIVNFKDRRRFNSEIRKMMLKDKHIGGLVSGKDLDASTIAMDPLESSRIKQYVAYDSIARNVGYAKKALNIITSNVVSPDDIITKEPLTVDRNNDEYEVLSDTEKYEYEFMTSNIGRALRHLDIQCRCDDIVRRTLTKGDYFAEIVDLEEKLGPESLSESENGVIVTDCIEVPVFLEGSSRDESGEERSTRSLNIDIVYPNRDFKLSIEKSKEVVCLFENMQDLLKDVEYFKMKEEKEKEKSEIKSSLRDGGAPSEKEVLVLKSLKDIFGNRVRIAYHEPEYVIKIGNERITLGYLVFPKHYGSKMASSGQMFGSYLRRFDAAGTDKDARVKDVLTSLLRNLEKSDVKINRKMKRDFMYTLAFSLMDYDDDRMEVRFVPEDRMIHFSTDVYSMYGTSIFENMELDAKIYTTLKVSQCISIVNKSIERNVAYVESVLPTKVGEAVQSLKQKLRKRRFVLDNLGTIDSIPSEIGSYETVYIPTKDNKKYVEFGKWEGTVGGNVNEIVENMRVVREDMLSDLECPPEWISMDSRRQKKESKEDSVFAAYIYKHQKNFNMKFKELVVKSYRMLSDCVGESSVMRLVDRIEVHFPAPKGLQMEALSEQINNAKMVVDGLVELGFPKDAVRNKYTLGFMRDVEFATDEIRTGMKLRKNLKMGYDETGLSGQRMGSGQENFEGADEFGGGFPAQPGGGF